LSARRQPKTREVIYRSGQCHVCRADLSLQEMRDHNYICNHCERDRREAEDTDDGWFGGIR
jgi:hypothetical protein